MKLIHYILSKKIILIFIIIFICMFIFRKKQEFIVQAYYMPNVSQQTEVIYPDSWRLGFPLWFVKMICPGYQAPSFLGNERYSFLEEPGDVVFIDILDLPLKTKWKSHIMRNPLWHRNCIYEHRIKHHNETMLSPMYPGAYKIGENFMEINSDSFYFVFPYIGIDGLKTTISVYKIERNHKKLVKKLQSRSPKSTDDEMSFELDFGSYEFDEEVEDLEKSGERCTIVRRVGICVKPAKQ